MARRASGTQGAAKPAGSGSQNPQKFNLHQHIAAVQRQMGTHFSPEGKQPGDIAWTGPCENGSQMVCRFDQDMQPSDCKPEPC